MHCTHSVRKRSTPYFAPHSPWAEFTWRRMQCQKKVTAVLNYLLQQEPRKLSEIVTTLPKMGVGRQVTRITWNIQDRTHQVKPFYWTITKVVTDQDMEDFKIWGVFCPRKTPEMAVKKVKASDYRHWLLLPKDYNTKKLNVSIEEELRALSASSSADAAAETHTTLADALDTAVETAGAPSEPQDTPVMPNPQS